MPGSSARTADKPGHRFGIECAADDDPVTSAQRDLDLPVRCRRIHDRRNRSADHLDPQKRSGFFVAGIETVIAQLFENHVGIGLLPPRHLGNRNAWNPRLRHNPPLLVIVPKLMPATLLTHR